VSARSEAFKSGYLKAIQDFKAILQETQIQSDPVDPVSEIWDAVELRRREVEKLDVGRESIERQGPLSESDKNSDNGDISRGEVFD